MEAGIYSVEFKSGNNLGMSGLLVIQNGTIHGGDLTYLYQGTYHPNGDKSDSLTAKLKVSHYRGAINAVVGSLKEFNLTLNLQKRGNGGFQAQGTVDELSGATLTAEGLKCADLVAQQPR